jgi:hypothetical protein
LEISGELPIAELSFLDYPHPKLDLAVSILGFPFSLNGILAENRMSYETQKSYQDSDTPQRSFHFFLQYKYGLSRYTHVLKKGLRYRATFFD